MPRLFGGSFREPALTHTPSDTDRTFVMVSEIIRTPLGRTVEVIIEFSG
jgi:hypothetical protein